MDKKQKANLLRSRAMMGNQNARKKRATEPDASSAETAESATAPTSTDAPMSRIEAVKDIFDLASDYWPEACLRPLTALGVTQAEFDEAKRTW